jgi:O-antigen/teichoic acid export membrane protein
VFASAAVATYGTYVAASMLSLANVLVVARALGPAGRGGVVFLTTVAVLSSQLASFGVQQSNVNIAGREPRLRPALATNSLLFAAVFGVVAAGFVYGLTELFPSTAVSTGAAARWLALASIPVLVLLVYLQNLAQADYAFALTNVTWLLPPLTTVVVNGVLAGLGELSISRAFAAWVGGQVLATALIVWYLTRRLAGFGRPDRSLARSMFGFGLKTHAGDVLMWGNYRLDQWLVGAISGSRELGLYSVAVAWTEGLFFVPSALRVVQRPDLVRADPQEAARRAATAFRAGVLLTAPLVLGFVVAAPLLTVTVFGERFRGSIDDLRVLALGGFGIVALKLLGNALTGQRRPLLEGAASAVAFLFTIVLDILLIPRHGGLGAAIASTASYTAGGIVVAVLFARALRARATDLVPRLGDIPWLWQRLRSVFRGRVSLAQGERS